MYMFIEYILWGIYSVQNTFYIHTVHVLYWIHSPRYIVCIKFIHHSFLCRIHTLAYTLHPEMFYLMRDWLRHVVLWQDVVLWQVCCASRDRPCLCHRESTLVPTSPRPASSRRTLPSRRGDTPRTRRGPSRTDWGTYPHPTNYSSTTD